MKNYMELNNLGLPKWVNEDLEIIDSLEKFPKDAIGFIYLIQLSNGKKYIGKKNLYTERKKHFGKKQIKQITDKRLKTYEIIKKESDWRSYIGSNKQLKEDVNNGVRILKREIILSCNNIKKLTFYEIKAMILYDVLIDSDFYNDNILGKFYRKDLI